MCNHNLRDKSTCDPSRAQYSDYESPTTDGRLDDDVCARLENAAAQLRRGRAEAEHEWDAALLRALEADCYEALTGGFRRASELAAGRERIMADGGDSR